MGIYRKEKVMLRNMSMKRRKMVVALMAGLLVLAVAGTAFAFMTPTGAATEVGFDLYDLIVNKFIKGPIGAAAGVALVVVGAVGAALGKLSGAVWPLIGGGVLVGAPGLASSLGMIF